jgi:hypothetical protein
VKLTDLDAKFLCRDDPGFFVGGPQAEERQQGVQFLCPVCIKLAGPRDADGMFRDRGVHSVICWFLNPLKGEPVPIDWRPGPGRWMRQGTTIETLTLGPGPTGQRSVLLIGEGCAAHFYVTNGEVQDA